MNNKLRSVVIGIVTAVWAMNFTAPIFVSDYKPSPELNVAFMAIIGVLTASYRMDKQSDQPAPPQPVVPPPPMPPIVVAPEKKRPAEEDPANAQ